MKNSIFDVTNRLKEKEKETEAIESRVNPTANKPANTAYWQGFGWPYMQYARLSAPQEGNSIKC